MGEPERGTDKPEEPEDPERAAPSSGTAAEPPHPDDPGAVRRGGGAGRKLVDLSDLWRNVKAAASFFFL